MDRPLGLENFRSTDREQCGIIVKNDDEIWVVEIPNIANNDSDYAIAVDDYHEAIGNLEPDDEVVGFFHTHLEHHDCEPTDVDYDGASLFPEFKNLIYKPNTDEVCWYGISDEVLD